MSTRPKLKYFGTSGIRGRTLIDITPNFAERMARAYTDVVLSGIDQPFVVIGRDTRFGAETLEIAIIAGLTAAGVSVKRCGIVPTPVLLNYQNYVKADGAVIITGSHIAPDRIGLIFIQSDGSYCSDHIASQIEQRFETFSEHDGLLVVNNLEDLKLIGKIEVETNVWEVYKNFLMSKVNIDIIKQFKGKVIIDSGNGTGAYFFSEFLHNLGLNTQAINDEHLPIPNRLSEPVDKNLEELKKRILDPSDIGIAFDLDADRVTFVVNLPSGVKTLSADHLGALFINELIQTELNGDIVLPVNSSYLAEVILDKFNKKPVYCKIGQPSTIEIVKKVPKPIFSYEESGKFYFLNDGILWTDGPLMALKVIELLVKSNKTLYDLMKEVFQDHINYTTLTKKLVFDEQKIMDLKSNFPQKLSKLKLPGEIERLDIDGIRINFEDRSWLMFRASGTEPAYRIVANGKNSMLAKKLIDQGEELLFGSKEE
ncbi:MAG: hypothetical protein ACW98A_14810 [Candidatus Hodarchaeales archaeon]|jgi:phosphomannomutase